MTNIITISFIVLIIFYNFSMFSYFSYLYEPTISQKKIIFFTTFINLTIFFIPQFISLGNTWPTIFNITSYMLQFKFIYKKSWTSCIFTSLMVTLNMYVLGVLTAAVIGFVTHGPIRLVRTNTWIKLVNTIASVGGATLQFYYFRWIYPKEKVYMLLSNKKSLQFACKIFVAIFLYVFIMANIDNSEQVDATRIAILHMKVGVVSTIGIQLAIVYSYLFAQLQMELEQFELYKSLVAEEEERIKTLNATVYKDSFTDLFLRDVGIERINFYKEHNINFYVCFIDMDGLKTVNDTFGHTEGDYYILKVVDILKRYFADALVCRLGGDEFLVVGAEDDKFKAMQSTLAVYGDVNILSKQDDKPYDTSISYGIVNIDETDGLDTNALVGLADHRMYTFKKSQNKVRNVKQIRR
ncbi:MAG: hypothetical protein ATN35_11215 [Epulopiscium sp. Nele67-Bin004]|nr:MAG: hypothetical protein ATN35_11215 [Epulopiscium sp. Nele67-Bin004]